VAAAVFLTMARRRQPGVVVLFGAVHVRHGSRAAMFSSGAWETPLGLVRVEERLAQRLLTQSGLIEADPHAHEEEHSLEVQVPFVQHLLPRTPIVPIMVLPNDKAAAVGASVGRTCQAYGVDAAFIGSTDLTHYGPAYGFTPQGVGPTGLAWAKDVNDRRMIELIVALREADAVGESLVNHNACGAGAIAATIAACKAAGAARATLLRHTTSHEVLSAIHDEPMRDAVGYAGIVFD
jgi:AmmeMemoRadiSam system protein B